jgi:predicted phage-related endonuclease
MSEPYRPFIGGSDLAAICGYYLPEHADAWCKYQTASDVWMRLVYGVARKKTAVMSRGLNAEPRLRKAFLEAYGGELYGRPEKWIELHPAMPFVGCSPDDVWIDADPLGESYVEWKTTSVFARKAWGDKLRDDCDDFDGDGAPEHYALQVQLNLEILGLERGYLFVGFGRDFKDTETGEPKFMYEETRRYRITRNRELIGFALGYAERFQREFIDTRNPPSVEPKHNRLAWKRILKGEKPWKQEAEAQSLTEAS